MIDEKNPFDLAVENLDLQLQPKILSPTEIPVPKETEEPELSLWHANINDETNRSMGMMGDTTDPTWKNKIHAYYIQERMTSDAPIGEAGLDDPTMKENMGERWQWSQEVLANEEKQIEMNPLYKAVGQRLQNVALQEAANVATLFSQKPWETARDVSKFVASNAIGWTVGRVAAPLGLIGKMAIGGAAGAAEGYGFETLLAPGMYDRLKKNLEAYNISPPNKDEWIKQREQWAAITGTIAGAIGGAMSPTAKKAAEESGKNTLNNIMVDAQKQAMARDYTITPTNDGIKYTNAINLVPVKDQTLLQTPAPPTLTTTILPPVPTVTIPTPEPVTPTAPPTPAVPTPEPTPPVTPPAPAAVPTPEPTPAIPTDIVPVAPVVPPTPVPAMPTTADIINDIYKDIDQVRNNIAPFIFDESLPQLNDITLSLKSTLTILKSLQIPNNVISDDDLMDIQYQLDQASLNARTSKSKQARAEAIQYIETLSDKILSQNRSDTIAPHIILKDTINHLTSLKKAIKKFPADLAKMHTIKTDKLTTTTVENLSNMAYNIIRNISLLEEYDPYGLNLDQDSKHALSKYIDIREALETIYRSLKTKLRYQGKVVDLDTTENKIEQVSKLALKGIQENNFFDMYNLSPFFHIKEDGGIPAFTADVMQYPINSEEELAAVFNKTMMDFIKKKPLNVTSVIKRDDTAIAFVFNRLLQHSNISWSNRVIYFNRMLQGLNKDQTDLFNKYRDNKDVDKAFYNAVENFGNLIKIPDYLPKELLDILNTLGANSAETNIMGIGGWRRLGVAMSSLRSGKGYIEQKHNRNKMMKLQPGMRNPVDVKNKWITFIEKILDWHSMSSYHGELTTPQSRQAFLSGAYDNIIGTDDGKYMVPQAGASLNKLHHQRVLIFKNYDGWRAYQDTYGHNESVITTVGDTIRKMSHQQATIQMFGHNAGVLANAIKDYFNHFEPRPTAGRTIPGVAKPGTDEQLAVMKGMIENGFNSLFEFGSVTSDPTFLEKWFDTANEVAIPYMLSNVAKFSFFIESIQSGIMAKQMGVSDAALPDIINMIGHVFKDSGIGLYQNLTPKILQELLGKPATVMYTDMLAVADIESAITLRRSPSSREDVWPIGAKISAEIRRVGQEPAEYLLEKGRVQSRTLIQRRLHESMTLSWDEINPLLKEQIFHPNGILKQDWDMIQPHLIHGTVAYNIQPNQTALRNPMFAPIRLLYHLNNQPPSHKNDLLINVAKKLEQGILTYLEQAHLQGDSLISSMVSPTMSKAAGKTTQNIIQFYLKKTYDMFTSWPRTFFTKQVYAKGGSWKGLFSMMAYMAIGGIIIESILALLRGENPLKQPVRTITRGVGLVTGYNFLLSILEKAVVEGGELTPKGVATGLAQGVQGSLPLGFQIPLNVATGMTETMLALYKGNTAKAMHSIRKMTPFRNYLPAKQIIDRGLLDNVFAAWNSSAAIQEWEMEMKDAQNRFADLYTLPGDWTPAKFEKHTREILKHKYGME